MNIQKAKQDSENWARSVLDRPNDYVILDTETTGFRSGDRVIEIGIINLFGATLLDSCIFTNAPISPGAYQIHKISNYGLKDAPKFDEIYPKIISLVQGKTILIYNSAFDIRMLRQTAADFNLQFPIDGQSVDCVMLKYAAWVGEYRRGSFKWQKLVGGDHSAVGDCKATLAYLQKMAGVEWVTN